MNAPVAILAGARDAALAARLLGEAGIGSACCSTPEDWLDRARAAVTGSVDLLIVAEERLSEPLVAALAAVLRAQPTWSDVPMLLIDGAGGEIHRVVSRHGLRNVTLIRRPMAVAEFVSQVQAALEARRRQYQVRALLEAQTQAAARKDHFLAMLAHELRNPLAPIRYATQLLAARAPEWPGVEPVAALMERQIAHLARLLDDLLEVSRVTRGLIRLERAPLDFAALVAEAVATHRPIAERRALRLVFTSPGTRVHVHADRHRLLQVIGNLLDNATKFTAEGGTVTVELNDTENEAVLRVRDTGRGLDRDELGSLFEPFGQADRSLDRQQGGLGLGLSIVRGMVELHGGRVSADSSGLGCGAEFTVRLPRLTLADVDARPASGAAVTGRPLSVLIAEDNVDAALTLEQLLALDGHAVRVVHDGPQAIVAAKSGQFDVLICDLGLPGCDGFAVARALADAADRPGRMLALTGYAAPEVRARALAVGFDGHLPKPVEHAALLAELYGRPAEPRARSELATVAWPEPDDASLTSQDGKAAAPTARAVSTSS